MPNSWVLVTPLGLSFCPRVPVSCCIHCSSWKCVGVCRVSPFWGFRVWGLPIVSVVVSFWCYLISRILIIYLAKPQKELQWRLEVGFWSLGCGALEFGKLGLGLSVLRYVEEVIVTTVIRAPSPKPQAPKSPTLRLPAPLLRQHFNEMEGSCVVNYNISGAIRL